MKKLILGCFIVLQLTGCAVWDAYTTAGFDNNEYALVNKVRTLSQQGSCEATSINELYNTSFELKNYTQYIPHNEKAIDMTNNLFKIVDELHNKKDITPVYCKAKLGIISSSAERIQEVVGRKTR
jgi:hypothetical protein